MKRQDSAIILNKLCPRCNRKFAADDDISCCPDDQSLLAPISSPLLNTVIDERYEIKSLLGSGASSEVFLAENKRLNKIVALKILHLTMVSDPAKVMRFQEEAKAVTRLKHSSIAEVHDYGLTADGRPYMVIDYIEGKSLADTLKDDGAIKEMQCCNYLTQLCNALEAAHNQGIVHRDIKPANIMFDSRKDENEQCRLLDFGVARTIFDDRQSDVTKTGEVLGTPAYMSPEQCLGHPVDGRSDIYSLGCVFHEMLNGERLVKADNQFDCMDWHLSKKAPGFKSKSTCCKDINIVLERMLAKNPEERYQSAAELKEDLSKILRGVPLGRAKKDHRKLAATFAAAAAVMLLSFFAVNLFVDSSVKVPQIEAEQADLAALKSMKLWMMLHTNQGSLDGAPRIIECNGYGPIKDGKRLNAPSYTFAATYAPEQNLFYCASADSFFKVSDRSAPQELLRSQGEIQLNNIESIAYDAKRSRVIMFGSGPDDHDYLVAYDTNAARSTHRNWSLLLTPIKTRGDQWREIRGLAYDAKNDRSYALTEPSDTATAIVQLAATGKRLGSIKLDTRVPLALNGNQFYVSNGLGIIFAPTDQLSIDYTLYVFELRTGKLLLKRPMSWEN